MSRLVGVDEVCVLGLNTNKGQKIELRLRTDDLQGFRKIQSIKKTLYHELAHNEHGPHDQVFYSLLRQIEKEVVELDWRQSTANTVGGSGTSGRLPPIAASTKVKVPPAKVHQNWHRMVPARVMAAQAAILRLSEEELDNQRGTRCRNTWTAVCFVLTNNPACLAPGCGFVDQAASALPETLADICRDCVEEHPTPAEEQPPVATPVPLPPALLGSPESVVDQPSFFNVFNVQNLFISTFFFP